MSQLRTEEFCVQGKRIKSYYNALPLDFKAGAYKFLKESFYKIGWSDVEHSNYPYLYSMFSSDDLLSFGFLPQLKKSLVGVNIDTKKISRTVVNLSIPGEPHWCHTHRGETVVLYYANPDWKQEWGGETLFFNEDLERIDYASAYTPGKIVVFDGEIPHTIRAQSTLAPTYRFTLSIFIKEHIDNIIGVSHAS